jgi:RNA recognition motif-containing protein
MYGYGYPISQSYNVPAIYPTYAPPTQMPIYSANTFGMPVNVRHGAVLTEARGIFIQNLSYKCTLSDLHSLLLTVGQPVDYKLLRDSRTGVFKGLATATFGSQDLAQRAAYCLNRVEHMGMTLSVRMDKETTAVGQTAPLIVDGSAYRVRSMCTTH